MTILLATSDTAAHMPGRSPYLPALWYALCAEQAGSSAAAPFSPGRLSRTTLSDGLTLSARTFHSPRAVVKDPHVLVHNVGTTLITSAGPQILTLDDLGHRAINNFSYQDNRFQRRWQLKDAQKQGVTVVVPNTYGVEDLEHWKYPAELVRMVPPGPPVWAQPVALTQATRVKSPFVGPYVVVFANRGRWSNVETALIALSSCFSDIPHRILLLGDYPRLAYKLGKLSRGLPLLPRRLTWCARPAAGDYALALAGADAAIVTSHYDMGCSNLLGALAHGVGVVAPIKSAASEMVAASDAVSFADPTSPASIEAGILRLLGRDVSSRRAAAQAEAKNFTWQAAAQAYRAIYTELGAE